MVVDYTRSRINLKKIQKIIDFTLKELNFIKNEINVFFVSEKVIKDLNKKFRKINRSTDVLSFAERDQKEKFINPVLTDNFLGEVYLCPNWIKKQAVQQGINFEEELTRVLIHGILHLVGYEHQEVSKSESEKMFQKQEEIISQFKKYV